MRARRAHAGPGGRYVPAEDAGPSSATEPAESLLVGLTSQMGSRRPPGSPTDEPEGADRLAAMPIIAHPFRLALAARECSVGKAAEILGVTRKTVGDWMAWRSRPADSRAYAIAHSLGIDDERELFPLLPETNERRSDDDDDT